MCIRACADAMFEDARGRWPSDMASSDRSNRLSVTPSRQNRVRINGSTSDPAIAPFHAEVSILVRLCAFLAVLAFSAEMRPLPEADIFTETPGSRRRRACFIENASKREIAGVAAVPLILARLCAFPGVCAGNLHSGWNIRERVRGSRRCFRLLLFRGYSTR